MCAYEEENALTVESAADAEGLLEDLAGIERDRKAITAQFQQMVDKYTHWKDTHLERLAKRETGIKLTLQAWTQEQLKDGKKKSVDLPFGRMGFRKAPDTWTLNGEAIDGESKALLEFVEAGYSNYVKTKTIKKVDWSGFKKSLKVENGTVITSDGEVIAGMAVTPQEPKFYVNLTEE